MLNKTSLRMIKYNESNIRLLIEEFKKGKKRVFAEIWQTVKPFIQRLIRYSLDKNTTSDLTGEVCISLFKKDIYKYNP